MKKNPAVLFGAFLVLIVAATLLFTRKTSTTDELAFDDEDLPADGTSLGKQVTAQPRPPTEKPKILSLPPAKTDQESLQQMAALLFEFTQEDRPLKELLGTLELAGQKPFTLSERNEYTGEMTIVRTKNPPPGTRYFHAQYFGGKDVEASVQHVSFEYKPGAQSMDDAIAALEKAFPGLGEPALRKDDFIQWDLDDGFVVWVRKLKANDLKEDPFNHYTPADTGTLRITVELNPEAD